MAARRMTDMAFTCQHKRDKNGFVLVTAMILAGIAAMLVFGLQNESLTQVKITARQEALEEALFVAEGGCALCLSHVMAGNSIPASINGTLGEGTYTASVCVQGNTAQLNYTLCSTGLVRGVRRVVTMDYVRSRSWAEFALWYDHYNGTINFVTGDNFRGKVHANDYIYISGSPVFQQILTSAKTTWGAGPGSGVFSNGYTLGVNPMVMSTVNFTNAASTQDCLKVLASLVVTGATTISMADTNFFISNAARGWTNYNWGASHAATMTNGEVYVATSGTQTGSLNIAGTLNGRLTIVTDGTINITNHIRYADNPQTNAASNDALGLITQSDIIVATNCPANLDIYAHMIATGAATGSTNDGMFTVANYDTRPQSSCSNLNVYGGIVEYYRGPVGTSGGSGTGYLKNYIFDTRFKNNPPPNYPAVGDQFYWGGWRDSP